MKHLIIWRLMWLLEHNQVFPCEMPGFQKGRGTAPAITDLATYPESTETAGDTAYFVFLDVCRLYGSLPHINILKQLAVSVLVDVYFC